MEIQWKYWKNTNLYIFLQYQILPHMTIFETFHEINEINICINSWFVGRILPIYYHGNCQKYYYFHAKNIYKKH